MVLKEVCMNDFYNDFDKLFTNVKIEHCSDIAICTVEPPTAQVVLDVAAWTGVKGKHRASRHC